MAECTADVIADRGTASRSSSASTGAATA